MILTEQQKQTYAENHGQLCPACQSPDICGHELEIEGMQVWQNVTCSACSESWRDVYKFDFVETEEELQKPIITPEEAHYIVNGYPPES